MAAVAPAVSPLGAVAQIFEALAGMTPAFPEPVAPESVDPEPGFVAPVFAARVPRALGSATPTSVARAFPVPVAGAGRGAVTSALLAVMARAAVTAASARPVLAASAVGTSFSVVAAGVVPVRTVVVRTVGEFRAPDAVVLGGLGADIALLSGVTRIQRVSVGEASVAVASAAEDPAVVEPDRWEPTVMERVAAELDGAAVPVGGGQPGEASGTVASDGLGAGGRVSVGRGPGRVLVACGVSRFVMVVPPRCAGVPNALWRCAGYARYRGRQTELGGMSLERGSARRRGARGRVSPDGLGCDDRSVDC
ncbi:hypothetical protein OHB54_18990 [Streptomyces sp. NBC_01007]|nr:hypothetical protein OHB54_18990 [Streptomyces sp. NBC_01007]